jgi:hypothetical protein
MSKIQLWAREEGIGNTTLAIHFTKENGSNGWCLKSSYIYKHVHRTHEDMITYTLPNRNTLTLQQKLFEGIMFKEDGARVEWNRMIKAGMITKNEKVL